MTLERVMRPGTIGTLALPHRIVTGAMHLGLESRDDGGAALAAFYVERVRGGAGLMVTGGSAVSRVGAGGRNYSFVNEPGDQARLDRVAADVRGAGGSLALQLFHAGRYASEAAFGLQPVGPSAVYSRFSGCEPLALNDAGIEATIADFEQGAARAVELGFAAIEIMASEGYLIDQFLSPITNRRDDDWGGDSERRMRFGVELLRRVRAAVGPAFPVMVRMTGADLMDGGASADEVVGFARALAAAGADALNIGVGWHEAPVPTVQAIVPPGTWIPVAVAVKEAVGALPVIASNRVNHLDMAETILADTRLDFISMARPFLADPELVARARSQRPINVCIACNQACIDRSLDDATVSCMVNPRAGRETELVPAAPVLAPQRLRTAVVGGGPAGLIAARTLAAAGHQVDLYEASDVLGGQFRLACLVPGKEDYAETVNYFAAELARLDVTVQLNRPITDADIALLAAYDGIIVATGVRPHRLELPGVDSPHVLAYPDAFAPGALGPRVAIIGAGGIAVDLAHRASREGPGPVTPRRFRDDWGVALPPAWLGERQRQGVEVPAIETAARTVTILQRGKRTGAHIGKSTRWAVLGELRRQGVDVVAGVTLVGIEPGGVRVDGDTGPHLVAADTIVIAAGQDHDGTVAALAVQAGTWHRSVGGARDVSGLDAVRAFSEGWVAADELSRSRPRVARR